MKSVKVLPVIISLYPKTIARHDDVIKKESTTSTEGRIIAFTKERTTLMKGRTMTSSEIVDSLWSVYDENQQFGTSRCEVENKLKHVLSNIPVNEQLTRNQVAKILHAFVRDVMEIPDIMDESVLQKATELRDLYDCRTCAADIMQVYLRGIMNVRYVIKETGMKLFGGREIFTNSELHEMEKRLIGVDKKYES